MEDEDGTQSKSLLYKLFYYSFCCFLCPRLLKKNKDAALPASGQGGDEEQELNDYEAVEKGDGEEEEAKDD